MRSVHKSVLVPYSAQQMFDLVERVEDYPKFLPWCGGTRILLSRSFIGWRENDRKSSLISPVRVYPKSRNNPGH